MNVNIASVQAEQITRSICINYAEEPSLTYAEIHDIVSSNDEVIEAERKITKCIMKNLPYSHIVDDLKSYISQFIVDYLEEKEI